MSRRRTRRPTGTVDVIVIGAGHCGLAMSHMLGRRGIEHRVLERGEVAHTWRTERRDSLRLLTPNWMTRLPGRAYSGDDPDGYMGVGEVVEFIAGYAAQMAAPVQTRSTVQRVEPSGERYRVVTDRGDYLARAVVLATGAFNVPLVPRLADAVPRGVQQLCAHGYRNPQQVGQGRVLVVGASATGLQLAQELADSGRAVTLAVGEHVRLPRVYRGRDIQWWMLASGVLDQRIEQVDDPRRARRVPSPQLVGTPERGTLDLNALQRQGVELVGRLAGIRDGKAQFSGSLRNVCALADLKMNRLLDAVDRWAMQGGAPGELHGQGEHGEPHGPGGHGELGAAERYAPTAIGASPRLGLTLGAEVDTVIWATGFRPDYSWLHVPVLDRDGALRHDGGVVDAPGLYAMGLPYLRRRKSSFIHGAEDDARELAQHLSSYLDRTTRSTSARSDSTRTNSTRTSSLRGA